MFSLKIVELIARHNYDNGQAQEGESFEEYKDRIVNKFQEGVDEAFNKQLDKSSEAFEELQKNLDDFIDTDLELWQPVIDGLKIFSVHCIDLKKIIEEMLVELEEGETFEKFYVEKVTLYLFSKLCRNFYGIVMLLEKGCTESAFALWHNMYEDLCISSFIFSSKNPEKVAFAYLRYIYDETGTHAWAKTDKRFSSIKTASVPFSRIEDKSGMRDIWLSRGFTIEKNLDSEEIDKGEVPEFAPYIHLPSASFNYDLVAAQAVHAIMIFSYNFFTLFHLSADVLFKISLLEKWDNRIDVLLDETREMLETKRLDKLKDFVDKFKKENPEDFHKIEELVAELRMAGKLEEGEEDSSDDEKSEKDEKKENE